MKKVLYFVVALIFLGVIGFGVYLSVKNMGSKESNKPADKEETKYKVTFVTNSEAVVEEQTIKKGEKVKKPQNPTRPGYDFENWYLEGTIYNFDNPVEENIVLIASWVSNTKNYYTVTLRYNNGEKDGKISVEEDGKISRPANPSKKGANFKGWYLNGNLYDFNKKVAENFTLEARWENQPQNNTTVNPSGVSLNKTTLKLNKGNSETLIATVSPSNATNKSLTWTSSNNGVATVSNGKVVAVNRGEATITVKTSNGKMATCKVTVDNPLQSITITKISGPDAIYFGGSTPIVLEAKLNPSDTSTQGNVSWYSDQAYGQNGSIQLSVNGNKVSVSPRSSGMGGMVTIKASLADKLTTYQIKVENKLTLYSVSGEVKNVNYSNNFAESTKYPATIKFNFNEPIKSVVEKNNIKSVSGEGTRTITAVVEAGGFSTPGLMTFRTAGGQSIKFHIARGY